MKLKRRKISTLRGVKLDYRCLSRVINSYEARDLFERVR